MEKLINRPIYLDELKRWQDKDIIKVVTGLRRCGKSTLFDLFIDYLLKSGIKDDQIIKINLEKKLFIPLSKINEIRRKALEMLERKRCI